jgi:hypothetical protein
MGERGGANLAIAVGANAGLGRFIKILTYRYRRGDSFFTRRVGEPNRFLPTRRIFFTKIHLHRFYHLPHRHFTRLVWSRNQIKLAKKFHISIYGTVWYAGS